MNLFTSPKIYDAEGDLSKRWYVFYFFKHPETGVNTRFRVSISSLLRTKADRYEKGLDIKNQLKKKLLRGFDPFVNLEKKSVNCIEALEYVTEYKKSTLKKRTGHTYSSIINFFVDWLKQKKIHVKGIEEISKKIAVDYLDHVILKDKVGNRTYNNRLQALRAAFNLLKKKDYVDFNPFDGIDYLPEQEPKLTAFTRAELNLISEKLPQYNYNLYVASQLIFYCFIRPAELVRLQFNDILWDHQTIIIPGTKSKNRKTEVIVMPDQLVKNLEKWNRNFPTTYYLFSRGKELSSGKTEIAPTRIAEAWRKFANENGITKNIYDLKHTGNGMAFDQDLNARDIQLQNRHHSLDQTQEYLNKFRRKPSEKFIKTFSGF
jgi:integrase